MASHWPFGHLQPKLWAKEGPGVKLAVWLPTTKSQESTFYRRRLEECDMALESSRRELQFWFKTRPNPSSRRGVMAVQSPRSPTGNILGLHFGSPNKMCHSHVASATSRKEYYKGEGGGFPRVRAVVSLVCPSAHGKSQHRRVSWMLN
jgi:hypothetical protein